MWGAVGLVGEVVDQTLAVLHLVGDDPGEVPGIQRRVVDIEAFLDEVGVLLVLGEDDRLAQSVAASNSYAFGHQVLEHPVDGVGVEEPLVELCGAYLVGRLQRDCPRRPHPSPTRPIRVFFVARSTRHSLIALTHELHRHRHSPGRYQVAVLDGVVQ